MKPSTMGKVISLSLTLLMLGMTTTMGKDVFFDFQLDTEIDNSLSPDCMNVREERRSMFLANGVFPGPPIEVTEGDNVTVRVRNLSKASTVSIHFHGIHQKGTPFSDGSASITQCALGPLQVQEYNFIAYPPGTHYWHEHASYHMVDGITGPLIVRPKDPEPFTYDEERTLFLQDWYIETGTQQLDGLLSFPFLFVGNPNSFLINGKGIAPECLQGGASFNNTLLCLATCQGDPLKLLSTISVTAGKTYRFRLINSGQLVLVNVAIAGHSMTIVQTEGTNVQPRKVSSIDIGPGQRYDVLVTADQPPASYMIEATVRERPIFDIKGMAILQYTGSPVVLPTVAPPHPLYSETTFGIAQDVSLKALDASKYPPFSALNATKVRRFILVGTQNEYFVNGAPDLLRWAVNNVSTVHGSDPMIARAVETARKLGWPKPIADTVELPSNPPFTWNYTNRVTDPGGPGRGLGMLADAIISIEQGEVIEFVLQNTRALNGAAEFHTWHAHGYSFWVVGQGEGTFKPETSVATFNLQNPVLRDTVSLQPLSWVAIRFLADNPGTWLFHCHILSHQIMGMGFTMVVQPDRIGNIPPSVEFCNDHQLNTPVGPNAAAPVNPPVKTPIATPSPISAPISAVAPVSSPVAPSKPKKDCGLFGWNLFCPLTGCGLVGRILKLCD